MKKALVSFDGYDLATRVVGEGVDVVCVHGWPLHGETFRMLEEIEGFRFHFIDLPGAGETVTRESRSYSIEAQAEVLAEYVRHIDPAEVFFVAHDSGGAVARYAARALGSVVKGLVLSGTEIPRKYPMVLRAFLTTLNTPLGGGLTKAIANRSVASLSGLPDDPEFRALFTDRLRDSDVRAGYVAMARDFRLEDLDRLEEVHRAIKAPVLLLWGSKDAFFPARHAREMASQFSGATEFQLYDGAGVFVHEEQPDWYRSHVARFLTQTATGAHQTGKVSAA